VQPAGTARESGPPTNGSLKGLRRRQAGHGFGQGVDAGWLNSVSQWHLVWSGYKTGAPHGEGLERGTSPGATTGDLCASATLTCAGAAQTSPRQRPQPTQRRHSQVRQGGAAPHASAPRPPHPARSQPRPGASQALPARGRAAWPEPAPRRPLDAPPLQRRRSRRESRRRAGESRGHGGRGRGRAIHADDPRRAHRLSSGGPHPDARHVCAHVVRARCHRALGRPACRAASSGSRPDSTSSATHSSRAPPRRGRPGGCGSRREGGARRKGRGRTGLPATAPHRRCSPQGPRPPRAGSSARRSAPLWAAAPWSHPWKKRLAVGEPRTGVENSERDLPGGRRPCLI